MKTQFAAYNQNLCMKVCNTCKRLLSLDNFPYRNKKRGWLSCYCRSCIKIKGHERYTMNKDIISEKNRKRRLNRRDHTIRKMIEYFIDHPCVDCGENDPLTLTFDHRDRHSKRCDISRMVTSNCSWETILTEIYKCDVRCGNCHLRKTAREQGHTMYRIMCEYNETPR